MLDDGNAARGLAVARVPVELPTKPQHFELAAYIGGFRKGQLAMSIGQVASRSESARGDDLGRLRYAPDRETKRGAPRWLRSAQLDRRGRVVETDVNVLPAVDRSERSIRDDAVDAYLDPTPGGLIEPNVEVIDVSQDLTVAVPLLAAPIDHPRRRFDLWRDVVGGGVRSRLAGEYQTN